MASTWLAALTAIIGALRQIAGLYARALERRRTHREALRDRKAAAFDRLSTAERARRKARQSRATGGNADDAPDPASLPDDGHRRD